MTVSELTFIGPHAVISEDVKNNECKLSRTQDEKMTTVSISRFPEA